MIVKKGEKDISGRYVIDQRVHACATAAPVSDSPCRSWPQGHARGGEQTHVEHCTYRRAGSRRGLVGSGP